MRVALPFPLPCPRGNRRMLSRAPGRATPADRGRPQVLGSPAAGSRAILGRFLSHQKGGFSGSRPNAEY